MMFAAFGGLLVAIGIGMPIAFALSTISIIILWYADVSMLVAVQRIYQGTNKFPFLAVPLFIFAGSLMNQADISRRLVDFAATLVGRMRGGLAGVNVITSMLFAGMSGTSMSDTAAVGGIMIPNMIKRGYDRAFTAAVTAASSTIGVLLPPSLPMVVLASYMGISTGALFIAGVVPGLLVGFGLIIAAWIISVIREYPVEEKFELGRFLRAFVAAIPPLLMPLIIIGGILGGVFTATEAAGIACIYGIIAGFFILRTLNMLKLYYAIRDAAILTGATMFVTATAHVLGFTFTFQQFSATITGYFNTADMGPLAVLFTLSLVMILLGIFLDGFAMMFIVVPLFLPTAISVGIEPIHFAMVLIMCWGLGQQTPPMASALFLTSLMARVDVISITRANLWFILVMGGILGLVILFPYQTVLWLPQKAGLL
ncbi:TRAP transporter large permease [Pararhodobacter oceanensis]|uniref:TRAP transporter large permease protein n=1 Tax=Pararhodobacter oceanensis TaxID=2172121 RepID=A0A2T8HT18_9RHOB|nr:TRAP transporter large permease [Pararhodobacter oceanensis]PVH28452.1 TRAP transporter large permease [Pararhodobacter oceanensis]